MRSLFLFLILATIDAFAQPTNILLDDALHHLGEKEVKGFPEPYRKPENPRLDLAFQAQSNFGEWTLRLDQRDVTDDWAIVLNGQRIARLNIIAPATTSYFSVPPNSILEGENKLAIVPSNPADDILVGKMELIPKALRDVRKLGRLIVDVTELGSKKPLPVRITVANAEGVFADLYNVRPADAAWRHGFAYSPGGPVEMDIPEGNWIVSATRGMEWSRPQASIHISLGQTARVSFPISRDVDTSGFIAADTHLHTYTYSGHGDASVDERVVTLAGEGVELAVATDHNHFTDYKPKQAALALSPYYTPVIGSEVTTGNGHFNAFPFQLDSKKPDHKETNWVRLVEDIRAKGAQYVILNHPRWPTITNSPFAKWNLNRADGSHASAFPMDAIEVLNSTVPLKESDFLLRDWFSLLSRGEKIWGVGTSDTHTVLDIPGQGRTYIASSGDDPGAIDVDAAIKSMQAGNMSIAYGIFGRATVNDATMGRLVAPTNGSLEVTFHIGAPSWIKPTNAIIYLNGLKVAETNLTMRPGAALNADYKFKIPAPAHDAFLVCVAFGEGVKDPSWATIAKYTLTVTNPIFIDADQDGKYASPRDTALRLLEKQNTLPKIETALAQVDEAIGVQLISEAKLRFPAAQLDAWTKLLEKLARKHDLFELYRLNTIPR